MVWIKASGSTSGTVRATRAAILDLLMDVEQSGLFYPGVERIEALGDDKFRWRMTTRRALGSTFTPEYVQQYKRHGDEAMSFETLSGNIKNQGRWSLAGSDGAVLVQASLTSELDAPVPRVLKKPAEIFAKKDIDTGLADQLRRIRETLER